MWSVRENEKISEYTRVTYDFEKYRPIELLGTRERERVLPFRTLLYAPEVTVFVRSTLDS